MEFLADYRWVIIVAAAVISVSAYAIYSFVKKPTTEQIKEVKEWLLYAVAEAEKTLGGGTGDLKLRYVYDLFLSKFPKLSCIISFDTFSNLVDQVLKEFRELLETNESVKSLIKDNIKD